MSECDLSAIPNVGINHRNDEHPGRRSQQLQILSRRLPPAHPEPPSIRTYRSRRHMDLLPFVSPPLRPLLLSNKLSMTGAMLALLAACRHPDLRQVIGKEVLTTGHHLQQLIQGWIKLCGDPSSPSVDQSLRIISEVTGFIEQEYYSEREY